MPWQILAISAIVLFWFWANAQGYQWVNRWEFLMIVWALLSNLRRTRSGDEDTTSGTVSPVAQVFEALFVEGGASTPTGEEADLADEYQPMMSDDDYGRIARLLSVRLPMMTWESLHEPAMRQHIEELIVNGQGLHQLEALFGGQVMEQTAQQLGTPSKVITDPTMRLAHEINKRQIESLIAAMPRSQTGTTLAGFEAEKYRRQHQPQARVVPAGLREGQRNRRMRFTPSPILRQYRLMQTQQLHAHMEELQPLSAPTAKPTADGRLTGASLNIRSIPPRYVR